MRVGTLWLLLFMRLRFIVAAAARLLLSHGHLVMVFGLRDNVLQLIQSLLSGVSSLSAAAALAFGTAASVAILLPSHHLDNSLNHYFL